MTWFSAPGVAGSPTLQPEKRIAVPWYRRVLGKLNARHTTGNVEEKGRGVAGGSIAIVFCLQGLSDDFH